MIKVIESTFSDVVSLPKLWQVYGFFQVIEKKLLSPISSQTGCLFQLQIFSLLLLYLLLQELWILIYRSL